MQMKTEGLSRSIFLLGLMQICILLPKEHSFIGAESTGEEDEGQDYFFFLGPVLIPTEPVFWRNCQLELRLAIQTPTLS